MSEKQFVSGVCIVLALIPVIVFCTLIPYKIEQDQTIEFEGVITEKNIDHGFGTAYIFVLNGTTDVIVNESNYKEFNIGEYVIIYCSGRITRL